MANSRPLSTQDSSETGDASAKTYTIGFILSLILTIVPFTLVAQKMLHGNVLIAALFGFALLQLYVQLVFFLHMGQGRDRRWNLAAFLFTVLVVLIVVLGSLWIMNNLHYNMESPRELDKRLIEKEGFKSR